MSGPTRMVLGCLLMLLGLTLALLSWDCYVDRSGQRNCPECLRE